jgi:hypothetical protein
VAKPADDLRRKASVFASDICDLINRTVVDGPRVNSVLDRDETPPVCYVGYRLSARCVVPYEAIPLLPGPQGQVFLHVYHVLRWDVEQMFLANQRAAFGLYTGAEMRSEQMLLRYDYDLQIRNNYDDVPYPVAHVHIGGELAALDDLGRHPGELSRLHFPVGGKRFRPCLEDVIEFAIVEGFATPRSNWQSALTEHREKWFEYQVGAATRRNAEVAAATLSMMGWTVTPPRAEHDIHQVGQARRRK